MHYFPGKRGEIHRIRLESELVDADWLDQRLRHIGLDKEQYFALLAIQDNISEILSVKEAESVLSALERRHFARPITHVGRTASWQLTHAGKIVLRALDIWLSDSPPPTPTHPARVIEMPLRGLGKSA